jgi:hypothetical protein
MQVLKEIFVISALQELYDGTGDKVFPMVLLTSVGDKIVVKSVAAFGAGTIASFLSPAVGNMIFFFGFMALSIGFLLSYVLPFMPFIYFFFAVVEWVMSIIEALIGAPLWALSHLRIEGDGLPGAGAAGGYMIIFGIILKPILIVFGLIASYTIFNAGAYFLNTMFGTAAQITQNGELSPLSFIAYLLIYAVICYNLGMVCFKMIDTIPEQVMRWLGQNVQNFKDGKQDPIGHVSGITQAAGTYMLIQAGNQVSGGIGAAKGSFKARSSERTTLAQTEWTNWILRKQTHDNDPANRGVAFPDPEPPKPNYR